MDFAFYFNEKSSPLLMFFVHGLVFSFLLIRKGVLQKRSSHKWLSLLLFLTSMYIAPYMFGYSNWYGGGYSRKVMFFVPFMQVLLIGPVIYFYTKSLLHVNFKLRKKDLIHFIPSILYMIYSLVVFVTDVFILDEYYFYADGHDKDMKVWYQATGFTSMAFYLVLSLRFYLNYKKLVFDKVSFAESILFRWIQNFAIALLIVLTLRGIFFFTNSVWQEYGSQFWYYFCFSIVFYYISINGYSNAVKVSALSDMENEEIDVFHEEEIGTAVEESPIEEKNINEWKERIIRLISDKRVFENPRLTLADVALELETNTKMISSVVNAGFQMNFNDFINHHRIEAVKEQLKNGEHKTSTLLGIALDCGFNSKATFNRAFKKSTGVTPKDYLKNAS